MRTNHRTTRYLAMLLGIMTQLTTTMGAVAAPVTEQQLADLIALNIDEAAIVEKIQRDGVDFVADDAAVVRLKEAGATPAVLKTLKDKSSSPPADAIVFDDVLKLVQLGIGDKAILDRLGRSPTLFVLDAQQEKQLRDAGASDALIAALAGQRTPPAQQAEVTDIALVLDVSASMLERTSDGEAKIDVAKRVVADLVRRIPEGLRLSVVIYGHDKELACRAVKVLRPLSELDAAGKADLDRQIATLVPVANTPIALALEQAGQQLATSNGSSGLILISDGKETCLGDPVGVAGRLASTLKLTFGVHVVGFDVDQQGRAQLTEVARAGHGKYYHAASAAELAEAVAAIGKLVKHQAPTPPPIQVQKGVVSAILVTPLTLEGFPELEEVYVIEAGGDPQAATFNYGMIVQQTKQLGQAMVLSPGKYDVIAQPRGGMRIALIKNVEVKARETVKIHANRVAAALVMADPQIEGMPEVKRLCAVPAGFSPKAATFNYGGVRQHGPGFGKPLLLTAGEPFDIVYEPVEGERVTIAENVRLEGGALTIYEGGVE